MLKLVKNIEDTIFDDGLPVNINPMISRLQEIVKECQDKGKDYKQDPRAKKVMWLINATFYNNHIGTIDMRETSIALKAE
ncbi:Uncharacterised protein [uncultured archaeon]|nr:Uncharacterised protein [uncultured archaeon]